MVEIPEESPRLPSPSANGRSRVGDQERDTACDELSRQFAEGRLTQDEFDERIGLATVAVTAADLHALVADLPRLADGRGGQSRPIPQPTPPGRLSLTGEPVLSATTVALVLAVVSALTMLGIGLTYGVMLSIQNYFWAILLGWGGSGVVFGITATYSAQAIGRHLRRSRSDRLEPPEISD